MKWVKASERLPEKAGKYYIKYFNHNGEKKSGSLFDGFKFPHHKTVVEWLDESQSPSTPSQETEAIAFAIWVESIRYVNYKISPEYYLFEGEGSGLKVKMKPLKDLYSIFKKTCLSEHGQEEQSQDDLLNEIYILIDGWGGKDGSALKNKLKSKYHLTKK